MTPPAAYRERIGYGTLPLRRILVVQTQRLGDVLCATPLFTALRGEFPEARITALVHRPHHLILEGSPDLDEVLTYDRQSTHRSLRSRLGLIGELRDREFDWALSIHAADSVAFALWQANIPWRTCVWRYGRRKPPPWARMFHQHIRQDRLDGTRHEVDHNLQVLRDLGLAPRHQGLRITLSAAEVAEGGRLLAELGRDPARPLAILHPGHGGGRQAWPASGYAEVGRGLQDRGWQVGVTGGPAEAAEAEAVARGVGSPDVLQLAGKTGLRQLAAVLGRAGLFVSVSTGPMHVASAMRVPAVTLYGPQDLHIESIRFCPYGTPSRAVFSHIPCTCPGSRFCANPVCLAGLTAEKVLAAADELTAGV
jgi:heptosyltransferase-3